MAEEQAVLEIEAGTRGRPDVVIAEVNYLGAMTERPWSDVLDLANTNIVREPVAVELRNAWAELNGIGLDKQGFAVLRHRTDVADFRDTEALFGQYNREMAALVRRVTGAALVLTPEMPVTRFSSDANSIKPGYVAHVDFTQDGVAARMLERGVDISSPELRRYSRFAIFQTWRALSGPGQDSTLALTDGRTIPASAVVEADFIRYQQKLRSDGAEETGAGEPGYNQFGMCHANPDHRWYFFPRLERDELLIWKGIDSASPDTNVLHSAVRDPSQAEAPPRDSVEARVYAFFN